MNLTLPELTLDVHALISAGMSPSLHWFPEDVPQTTLAATLVAMANTDGGMVILGVSPRAGELVGIRDVPAVVDKVFQAAALSEPTLVMPMARQVSAHPQGKPDPVNLLLIQVPHGLPHIYCLDGRYLGRDGSHTSPLPARRLYQLLQERGFVQFESQLVPEAGLEDLVTAQVQAYAEAVGNIPAQDVQKSHQFLVKRGCLHRHGDEMRLTYAALLLFGRNPQQWLPNATILAARFPGSSMSDTYVKRDITGNLPEQLQQVEGFVTANLKTVVRLAGLTHQEQLEYPYEAVRELLVNAVAHRDYNLQGDNTHLNIYDDRLVVTSPGTLPGPVTLQNLLEARFARNAVISQVLSDLGYVERLGYGLDRVVEATRQAGLLPPQFEEAAGTFRVTLFGSVPGARLEGSLPDLSTYARLELNPRQQAALAQMATNKRITSHEFQALCPEVHPETLRRDLADLVTRGIVIKVGDKKATYYILKRV